MALDPTLSTPNSLPGDAPEQTLALITVRRRSGRPRDKIVRSRTADGVYQSLQGFLVNVHFLCKDIKLINNVSVLWSVRS